MLSDLTASKTSPLNLNKGDVIVPVIRGRGMILLDVAARADATLVALTGTNGWIIPSLCTGHLGGEQVLGAVDRSEGPFGAENADGIQHQVLDAEDALGLDDGRPHTITVTVNETGTHLYADGYKYFPTTLTGFLVQIGLTEIRIDPGGIAAATRLTAWDEPLNDCAVMTQSLPTTPLIQFAASELFARDAHRTGTLATGSVRIPLCTRGRDQAGTTIAASGQGDTLHLDTDAEGSNYRALLSKDSFETEPLIEARVPGHWDDGTQHDVVATSGRGVVEIHVGSYQVAFVPGGAFLVNIAPTMRVVVGTDLDGRRLFGEAQITMIYNVALTDAQVKRLVGVVPLSTCALLDTGYHDVRSYRTPSLFTLDSGIILAGADQRVSTPNDASNGTNLVMRHSPGGGATWKEMRTLLSLPDTEVLGASLIDSVLVQDHPTEHIICLVDQFPGGIGQPNAAVDTGLGEQGRRVLHSHAGELFAIEPDGSVVTETGEVTDYHVILSGDDAAGMRAGDVLRDGRVAGGICLAYEQAPEDRLFQHRGSHLLTFTSNDDGATWPEPIDIIAQVKADWICFLGTDPSNVIQLITSEHIGRVLTSVYCSHEVGGTTYLSCTAIYSGGGGATWALSVSPNNGHEVVGAIAHSRYLADERASLYKSVLVEGTDDTVHVWARNQHPLGRVVHAVSHDGGVTWGEVDYDTQFPEIFSQPNVTAITSLKGAAEAGDGDGVKGVVDRGIVFANVSRMLPSRGHGVLRLSYDDGATWSHSRVVNPHHRVCQCTAQLPNGDVALL